MENIPAISEEIKLPAVFKKEIKGMIRRKKGSEILAFTYEKTYLPDGEEKAKRLRFCGKKIIMVENPTGEKPIPVSVMRCGLRLCPSCSWKRSRQIFENVYDIITAAEFKNKQFIFLTLTVKNCRGEELENEISRLLLAWQILTNTDRSSFRRSFSGTFRALEVTYNPLKKTYHPHLHALAAVEPDYFKKSNKHYLSQPELRKLWKDACRLTYLPQCRIQRVKNSTGKQVAEVAKYTVKSADYLNRPEVVETLDKALFRKRLIAYGGLFKDVRKRLGLPDEDDISEEFPRPTVEELLKNPYIKKMIFEWKLGTYHVSLCSLQVIPPTGWNPEGSRPRRSGRGSRGRFSPLLTAFCSQKVE